MAYEKLKFPVGRFRLPDVITESIRNEWISQITTLPDRLEAALNGMADEKLETPYRPGGWTVRQLVHHIADSHMNAFIRFRLALTEEKPTIKPYEEKNWAKISDAKMPVAPSLDILRGLHARWAFMLRNLDEAELKKTFIHPEHGQSFTVDETIGSYAHHGENHLAQITGLKERMGW